MSNFLTLIQDSPALQTRRQTDSLQTESSAQLAPSDHFRARATAPILTGGPSYVLCPVFQSRGPASSIAGLLGEVRLLYVAGYPSARKVRPKALLLLRHMEFEPVSKSAENSPMPMRFIPNNVCDWRARQRRRGFPLPASRIYVPGVCSPCADSCRVFRRCRGWSYPWPAMTAPPSPAA